MGPSHLLVKFSPWGLRGLAWLVQYLNFGGIAFNCNRTHVVSKMCGRYGLIRSRKHVGLNSVAEHEMLGGRSASYLGEFRKYFEAS